jgi:hypothetical protein
MALQHCLALPCGRVTVHFIYHSMLVLLYKFQDALQQKYACIIHWFNSFSKIYGQKTRCIPVHDFVLKTRKTQLQASSI